MNIEIQDSIFRALAKRVVGFGDTPNDVIKRLLDEADEDGCAAQPNHKPRPDNGPKVDTKPDPLAVLVESPEYKRRDGKGRYFEVLRFLYNNSKEFAKLNGYRKGRRIQISTSAENIEQHGKSTIPQKLEGTPYWVSTNLSHQRKRAILDDILRLLRYPNDVIDLVMKSIPDEGTSLRTYQ